MFLVLVTPEIVDAIALLIWYVRIKGPFGPDFVVVGNNYGLLRLWVGHALFSTAVVTLIVRARLAGLDESLEEAGADLYAAPFTRFRQITLPLMMPAVLAGALLAFSLSLDNTIISTFVSVAGASPWPVYVFSALRSILRPEIAAVSTLMLLLTLIALAWSRWCSGGAVIRPKRSPRRSPAPGSAPDPHRRGPPPRLHRRAAGARDARPRARAERPRGDRAGLRRDAPGGARRRRPTSEVVEAGRSAADVDVGLDGVADVVPEIRVEVLLDEGTRLIVLREPFGPASVDGPGAVRFARRRRRARARPGAPADHGHEHRPAPRARVVALPVLAGEPVA